MEKNNVNSDLPKTYLRIKAGMLLELMEDYPPYLDKSVAKEKSKSIKKDLEVRVRVMGHNGRYFLYRVIANKQCKK